MLGRLKERFGLTSLDDLTVFHHTDPIGDFAHHAEVMGDEEQAHALGLFKLCEQVKDLRLDCHIERRGGLVGDQKFRPIGERHGDHDPLALPAGELVGIRVQTVLGVADTHFGEQLDNPRAYGIAAQTLVQFDALTQLLFQRVQRVKRRHGLLEDKRDVIATHFAQCWLVGVDHLIIHVAHRALDLGAFA